MDPDEERILSLNWDDNICDIYDEAQRDIMLEDDEITLKEYEFMAGRTMKLSKKKWGWREHTDTLSVKLAEEDYKDD